MKRILTALAFVAFSNLLNAQAELYPKLKKLIHDTHPELSTDNKLIAVNAWSLNDAESREANKSFDKVYKVYATARLKGGLNGIIVITVNTDNAGNMAIIALNKDGVTRLVQVNATELKELSQAPAGNVIFDSNGSTVYKDLPSKKIFESVNQLLTR